MKKILYCLFITALFTTSCGDIDNYDEPKEILQGTVTDEVTGQPLITEQPNGFRIKMKEISWSENAREEYFWGKADGTFYNKRLFKGTYEFTPVEGPFFPVEAKTVDVKGTVTVDFTVTPYLSISEPVITRIDAQSVEVSYTLSRKKAGDKIIDTRVFVSKNPNVGFNIFDTDASPMTDLSEIDDVDVLATNFKITVSNLKAGETYYLRVGARTDNPQKRYNFTKIVELKN